MALNASNEGCDAEKDECKLPELVDQHDRWCRWASLRLGSRALALAHLELERSTLYDTL